MRTYCRAQGTLLSALRSPKWEANPKGRKYIHMYGRLIFLCSRNTTLLTTIWDLAVNPDLPYDVVT